MLEYSQARELTFCLARERAELWTTERVDVVSAVGRVLAEDVRAEAPIPLRDYSAMDGYAVRSADFPDASDTALGFPVQGEVFAGSEPVLLTPGSALRIFTGAPLPQGADAVIMQENVERLGDRMQTAHRPRPGDHVRRSGEDLAVGDVGLGRGQRVTEFSVGLLATLERVEVLVAARPRVGILCTGDELRPPGRPGGAGLAESNGVSLAALVRRAGGLPERGPVLQDSLGETERALEEAMSRYDVVLTVGGVSVGDHDYVRPALERLGAETVFSKVRIKPGKPVTVMKRGDCIIVGLPGNPASAQVTFALFVLPLLRLLQRDVGAVPARRTARLDGSVGQKSGRTTFYRGVLEGQTVRLLSNQASGASTAMAWANCLVCVPDDVDDLVTGAEVEVLAYADL